MSASFEFPVYPILALLAAVVVVVPLPWHLQAWNSGTCLFMLWTAIGCMNYGINAIIWRADVIDRAPVWCDISSRIIVAVGVGIPAASLCINRRLYKIASVTAVTITKAEKHRAVLIDLAIAFGIPVAQLIAEFVISGHRYDLYEQIGCYPFIYNTPLTFPLFSVWPIVIGLCSAVYCTLALRAFAVRRAQFSRYLAATSSLTIGRYFRLMAIATAELMCTTPIAAYGLYLNATSPIYPWISFSDTHFDYSRVDQYPSVVWKMSTSAVISFEFSRWSVVFCALLFFAFFGFADEARRHYSKVLAPLVNLVCRLRHNEPSHQVFATQKDVFRNVSVGSLPVYYPSTMSLPTEKGDRPPRLHLDFESESVDLSPPPTAYAGSFRSLSLRGVAV
ncbi:pheromone A receptor-domain-containing protein [Dichomitus squalens]|uniref:Pheromone A receptor-domain-containing protein n=1 Tax=Dichomitus squalens TaxID=114155 RepID=A0A4Q9MQC8_9APHY|nr:pheromone A receptor-domain-containing protein [Dichomitus squalens]